jgi:hypothetical protein
MQTQPYPYRLLFNEFLYRQFPSTVNHIYVLSNASDSDQENIHVDFLLEISRHCQHFPKLKKLHLDYTFTNSFLQRILHNGTEQDLINLLVLLPPKQMDTSIPLTLNTWKALYSIFFDSYNFHSANVKYDMTSALNLGIAYSLREKLYYDWKTNHILLKAVRWALYELLSVFVADVP